jgi:hypothetical protein
MPTAVENTIQKAAIGAFNTSQAFLNAMPALDQAMKDLAKAAPSMSPFEYSRALNVLNTIMRQLDQVNQLFDSGQKTRQKLLQACIQNKSKTA